MVRSTPRRKSKPTKMGKKKSALASLTPNAQIVLIDGSELRVPADRAENSVMNMILASQMRNLIQEQIKKYKDADATMSPKELNDLASAARNTAAFSSDVYAGIQELPKAKEVSAAGEIISDEPDFSKLGKPIEVKAEEVKDEQRPNPDAG